MEIIFRQFQKRVNANPDNIALKFKLDGFWKEISYSELYRKIENFAFFLLSEGIKKGDKIAIISKNCMGWIIGDFATQAVGAVTVPVYNTLTSRQIEYIVKDAGCILVLLEDREQYEKILPFRDSFKTIITFDENNDDNLKTLEELSENNKELEKKFRTDFEKRLSEISPEDLMSLIYTSGTTGEPKGAMLSHKNLASNLMSINAVAKELFKGWEVSLSFLPFSHIYARTAEYYCFLVNGHTLALAESMEKIPENLQEIKPTILYSVPRLYEKVYSKIMNGVKSGSPIKKMLFEKAISDGKKYFLENKRTLISLIKNRIFTKLVYSKIKNGVGGRIRYLLSGGGPLAPEIAEFFHSSGIRLLEGYGLTEASPVLTFNTPAQFKIGTVGKPVLGVSVKLAEDGEILAKGDNIMKGYYNRPDETRETITEDGWLHTGDIGDWQDGFLKIVDRKKDIFVLSSGKNVAPQPIEKKLVLNRFISQALLIGDSRNFISALLVPDFEELKSYCSEKNLKSDNREELLRQSEIKTLYDKILEEVNKEFARFEQIKKYTLLPSEFTIEGGELTPTLKIKRKVVANNYKQIIDSFYQ